jgi:predicted lipid-binding transport protein (Tim44 family)
MKGMAGGLLGGMIGSMLFGGVASGMGGGFAGTGLGLFDILLIGGIIYFIYTRFVKKKQTVNQGIGGNDTMTPPSSGGYSQEAGTARYSGGLDAPPLSNGVPDAPPPPPTPASSIDEEEFLEFAQDIFFRIQAAWMHRDISAVRELVGPELAALYESEFRKMQETGRVNRLENIAVRKVEVTEHGFDGDYEFVKVRFKANLLDYTVDERSGEVVEGDANNPVKFEEIWTFARYGAGDKWRLYGIEELS